MASAQKVQRVGRVGDVTSKKAGKMLGVGVSESNL